MTLKVLVSRLRFIPSIKENTIFGKRRKSLAHSLILKNPMFFSARYAYIYTNKKEKLSTYQIDWNHHYQYPVYYPIISHVLVIPIQVENSFQQYFQIEAHFSVNQAHTTNKQFNQKKSFFFK